jgi:hypothetical protein
MALLLAIVFGYNTWQPQHEQIRSDMTQETNETILTWVYEESLQPFLIVLGWLVKYDFDPMDWDAIGPGVLKTSAEDNQWYEYVFVGELQTRFRIAHENGCCLYHIVLEAPAELKDRIELAVSILNKFRLTEELTDWDKRKNATPP